MLSACSSDVYHVCGCVCACVCDKFSMPPLQAAAIYPVKVRKTEEDYLEASGVSTEAAPTAAAASEAFTVLHNPTFAAASSAASGQMVSPPSAPASIPTKMTPGAGEMAVAHAAKQLRPVQARKSGTRAVSGVNKATAVGIQCPQSTERSTAAIPRQV